MRHKLNFLTLWAVNGRLDTEHMKRQMDNMRAMGFHGTIFHPRYYPGTPAYMSREYLDIVSQLILYAKETGMQFWIYDENGWPSGTADGKVLERFPDSRCQWIQYENGEVVWHETHDFNTFDREEMKYFVEVIYDGYRQGLQPEAFDYVTGFFSDEVGFLNGHGVSVSHGGIPWCEEAKERYETLYQEDITEKLELLFTERDGYHQVRYRYWQILTDILCEAFYENINDWCIRYGKRYTAHLKAEENLFFQTSYSGSACWNLKSVNMPAVDALERYPGNHYYPRIASSAAKQFSDGQSLAEALGGSGWGLSPEDFERYVDWLAESGINNMVFHLWQYDRSSASVRDWPPNIPMGLTWGEMIREIFSRLEARWNGTVGKPVRVLIVAPARGVMASFDPKDAGVINEHNGAGTPPTESGNISMEFNEFIEQCYEMGLEYDVTEERILESFGMADQGVFRLGNAVYDTVIEGNGCLWEDEPMIQSLRTGRLLRSQEEFTWKFLEAGENQLFLERMESRIPLRLARPVPGMCVRILDPVQSVQVMGKEIAPSFRDENGWYYGIPDDTAEEAFKRKELCISIVPAEEREPFAFLKGDFFVKSETPYIEKDRSQMVTEGGFYLENSSQAVSCCDLLAAGYPFCDSDVTVECSAAAGSDGRIKLGCIYGDCAEVWVDQRRYGYVWGPNWEITGLSEGIHHIRMTLTPSTYNSFGPHHHMDGDRRLTSPAQYAGVKNFADSLDTPDCTRVPQWHFRKFGIGRL